MRSVGDVVSPELRLRAALVFLTALTCVNFIYLLDRGKPVQVSLAALAFPGRVAFVVTAAVGLWAAWRVLSTFYSHCLASKATAFRKFLWCGVLLAWPGPLLYYALVYRKSDRTNLSRESS
jgi:hypothetical protein